MRCLKCGRKIESDAVFCQGCSEGMENEPVSRETPLILNSRPQRPKEKDKKKKAITPAEVIAKLQTQRKGLTIAVVVLSILCALLLAGLILALTRPELPYGLGQNYNTVQQSNPQTGGESQ